MNKYKCSLCEISYGSETYYGSKQDVIEHIKEHGIDDIDLCLNKATTQTELC